MPEHAVISESEYTYLKQIIDDGSAQRHQQQLIAASTLRESCGDRVKNWPNTIDALRTRKHQARAERLFQEEERRKLIDQEEKEFQDSRKKEIVREANTVLYESQESIRKIHSQLLLDDVVRERQEQLMLKSARKQKEEQDKLKWHNKVEAQRISAEATEKLKQIEKKSQAHQLREELTKQIKEQTVLRLTELQMLKDEGRKIRQAAEAHAEEEKAQLSARKEKALELNKKRRDDLALKVQLQTATTAKYDEIEEARQRYDQFKTEQTMKRNAHDTNKRSQQKQTREYVASLLPLTNKYSDLEKRSAQQMDAVLAKEQQEQLAAEERRRQDIELIHSNRQQQLQRKKDERLKKEREEHDIAERIRRNLELLNQEDQQEKLSARQEAQYALHLQGLQLNAKKAEKENSKRLKSMEREAYNEAVRSEKEAFDSYLALLPH